MKTRIYLVCGKNKERRMIEAISIAQALRHVSKGYFTCNVLNSGEAVREVGAGIVLEVANDTPEV